MNTEPIQDGPRGIPQGLPGESSGGSLHGIPGCLNEMRRRCRRTFPLPRNRFQPPAQNHARFVSFQMSFGLGSCELRANETLEETLHLARMVPKRSPKGSQGNRLGFPPWKPLRASPGHASKRGDGDARAHSSYQNKDSTQNRTIISLGSSQPLVFGLYTVSLKLEKARRLNKH